VPKLNHGTYIEIRYPIEGTFENFGKLYATDVVLVIIEIPVH
jgi:hypothetical protein